ncbi:MAG: DUF2076 domain-containing protein [Bryobacteraceae bacterium]|jgi:hypothetical protein
MTDQERQMIEELARRIQSAPAPQVDREADDLIRRSIGARPDALYILTQTVLIQEMALNQARAQIDDLKRQAAQPQPGTSFLGSSYQGGNAPQPPPLPPQYGGPQYDPQYQPPPSGGRFSSFLHNAAQTAAGVVAGEVAFSALSSLFGGHQGGFYGGGSGFLGGGGGISPGSETIINNYYGDDRERGGRDDAGLSRDLEDRRFADDDSTVDDADRQPDTDYSDDNTDVTGGDDSSYDDGSSSGDL